MPGWEVHNRLAVVCGISGGLMAEINRFIDEGPGVKGYDPEWHDFNRVIVNGRWLPEALLYMAAFIYEYFNGSCQALKATLHHHIVDYVYTVISGGKYGWMLKEIIDVRRGFAGDRVCEEDDPRIKCVGTYAQEAAEPFAARVLQGIIEDFKPLLTADSNTLLGILKDRFPGVFTDEEIWIADEALIFGPQAPSHIRERFESEVLSKVKLVEETVKCLVNSAEELLKCSHTMAKELVKYRCREITANT